MKILPLIPQYLKWMIVVGKSPKTAAGVKSSLKRLCNWLVNQKIIHIEQITREILREYQEDLIWHTNRKGNLITVRTRLSVIGHIKGLFKWMAESDLIVSDPAARLQNPKQPKTLPREILEIHEIKKILSSPDTQTKRGYRDRCVLELLYSTGIRRSEAANLRVSDVDYEAGFLTIRQGKGQKDRVVPLGKIASQYLQNYITGLRPERIHGKDEGFLFLNRFGEAAGHNTIYDIVRKYVKLSGIKKKISPHTFRHTCATHMLKNGAHLRYLQEMLGHKSIETTQIYTRVTITELKACHAKHHPREAFSQENL